MKKILLSVISTNLLLGSLYATTLKEVVVKTLDNNADILSEKFNKEAYKKYIDEEKGDYYPTLDFDGYVEDSTTRLNPDDDVSSKASKDGWNVALRFEQILYDGGVTPSEVEEFRHRYYSNKFRSDRRVEEIVRTSVNSYINLVKYQELMDISQNSIKVHGDYLEIAQEKEKISGELLESFQVNSKKHFVIDTYLEQKLEKNQSIYKFEELTSQVIEGNICRPEINEKLIPNTLAKTIEDALRKNTKILEAVENIKEQRENIVQANAANLPSLRFQWQMTWDDDLAEAENGREDINRVRLIVNWNLFEGGKTRIEKQREKLFLQEQQKILDTLTNEVIQEVKTSYVNYYDRKAKVENIKKYVQDNKNIKDIYFKQLEDGTRTFIDILNAESEYFRSQIDTIEQEYELYNLYYDLLAHRNMLSDSILMAKNQTCKQFTGVKYNKFNNKQDSSENNESQDLDLLEELGEDVAQTDKEIEALIEGNPTAEKKIEENNENSISFPSGKYTINIATLDKDKDLDTFIKKMNLNNENIIKYNLNKNTKVLYGNYTSLTEASNVIKNFSQELIDNGVYVDSLEKHRKIFNKYKTIN